jgi:hypothetical protein
MAAIWLDASTIGDIADGDAALEMVIKSLGGPLLIVPKVWEELHSGNPLKPNSPPRSADGIARSDKAIARLGAQRDMRGDAALRWELFEKGFKFKKDRTVVRAIEESDAIVLSEIAASAREQNIAKPKLITTDKRLVNAGDARAWGVEISLPDPALLDQARAKRAKVTNALIEMLENIKMQHDRSFGEHQAQQGIIITPSVTGFVGFWTNRLFNTDVPPLDIWTPCFTSMAHARRLLREGDLPNAASAVMRARGDLLKATAIYRRWKDGIEGAGTMMIATIVVVAAVLIFAAVGAFALTAEEPAAVAAVNRLAATVAQGDQLALRVATAEGAEAAKALAEWEAALAEVEREVNILLTL